MFLTMLLLFIDKPVVISAGMFSPKKLVALKNILTSRFRKSSNAKELLEAEIKEISKRTKLDWSDLHNMAKTHLSLEDKAATWALIKKEGVDMEEELTNSKAGKKDATDKNVDTALADDIEKDLIEEGED